MGDIIRDDSLKHTDLYRLKNINDVDLSEMKETANIQQDNIREWNHSKRKVQEAFVGIH